MKQFYTIVLIILIVSCSSRTNQIEISLNFPIHIDSTNFIGNLEYDKIGYKELPNSWRRKLEIDRISEMHGKEYLYRIFDAGTIDGGKDFSISFVYIARNDRIPVDAYWEKYYIMTIDAEKEPISVLEIAAYEAHPGQEIEKSCTITRELNISSKVVEMTEDWGSGNVEESKSTHRFGITENGKIVPIANAR